MNRSVPYAAIASAVLSFTAAPPGIADGAHALPPASTPSIESEVPVPTGYPYSLTRPDTVKIPALDYQPPTARREVLPNGLVVYLMENHELPVLDIIAYTRAGTAFDPEGKAGVGSLTGTVMRTGGTDSQSGDQIDAALEQVGGTVETSVGQENAAATASGLAKDEDLIVRTLADVLQRPAFNSQKLELARNQALEGIRRENDSPTQIASREFGRVVYGPKSSWADLVTAASVRSVTRDDLIAFHHRYFHPNTTFMGVAGDFKADEMLDRLRKYFGSWPRTVPDIPSIAPLQDVTSPKVFVVERDLPQTVIRIGHLGMRRHSPDKPAVDVMNEIFGLGGFTSRLMREIRSNRGLAYSVSGFVGVGVDRGLFLTEAETKTESATQTAQLMRQLIEEMRTKPVTEREVKLAQDAILNSYVFRYATPFAVASTLAEYEMKGYPADYLKTYPEEIRRVTPAMVETVAKKYLHPDRMIVLLVGKTGGLTPPVSTLGPITPIRLEEAVEPTGKGGTAPGPSH